MRFSVRFLLTILVSACFAGDCSGQTASTSFIRIDEIPAAATGTHESYYDVQTGDFLVSIGAELLTFGIDFSDGNNANAFDG